MNRDVRRVVLAHPAGVLPPVQDEGRTRILFLTLDVIGWSTYASTLVASTAARDDIDAVHVLYQGRGIKRLFSAPIPKGPGLWDSSVRRVLLARWLIERWLQGPLDLSRFDVVHVTPQQYAVGFIDAAERAGIPLSTLMDATVLQERGELLGHSDEVVRRRWGPLISIEQQVFDAADLVVATSKWAADAAHADFSVPSGKLVVSPLTLPKGLTGSLPTARPVNAPARIVFVGLDFKRKGGDRLLRWHQERWADIAELHLCTSEPPPRGARNVVFHGVMPHDELLQRLLPSMDLFVLPTACDMTPWAVLEAAAVGLPVVSSSIGGIGEMVVDGATGLLRHPTDEAGYVEAIETLLADPGLRQRMGTAARTHAQAHTEARVGHEQVLDRLVALDRHRDGRDRRRSAADSAEAPRQAPSSGDARRSTG